MDEGFYWQKTKFSCTMQKKVKNVHDDVRENIALRDSDEQKNPSQSHLDKRFNWQRTNFSCKMQKKSQSGNPLGMCLMI